jgi:hypothetical protein
MAAYAQNDYKAGILVNKPKQNANISQRAAADIEGPTLVIPILTFSCIDSPYAYFIELEIINILSTPIANIKNGITSAFNY